MAVPRYIAGYNALNLIDGTPYVGAMIGKNTVPTGPRWDRATSAAIDVRAGQFDSNGINAPCPVNIDGRLFVYYAGRNAAGTWQIGYAELDPETFATIARPTTPLLALGAAGSWEAQKHFRPIVQRNPDWTAPAGERWVMFYGGQKIAGSTPGDHHVGLAFSPDGVTWTKYPGNPILSPGAAGSWDAGWIGGTTNVVKSGGTLYLYYTGYDDSANLWSQIGLATSTGGVKGPWTKHASNPVVQRAPSAYTPLFTPPVAGDAWATWTQLGSTSPFTVGAKVLIASISGVELREVVSVTPGSPSFGFYPMTLVFDSALALTHAPGSGPVYLAQVDSGKISSERIARAADGTWRLHLTTYNYPWNYAGTGAVGVELTSLATSPDLVTWTKQWGETPLLDFDATASGRIDRTSQENLSWIDWTAPVDTVGRSIAMPYTVGSSAPKLWPTLRRLLPSSLFATWPTLRRLRHAPGAVVTRPFYAPLDSSSVTAPLDMSSATAPLDMDVEV